MQPNPDPKPGRWILPVVILAMMGFAWLFINAAEDPTISATDTTVSGGSGGTTTTTLPAATTTTTAVPPDVAQYNLDITGAGIEMAGLQERIVKANDDWEARTVGYGATLSALRALDVEVKAWRTGIDDITVPTSLPEYADFHSIMVAAAGEVVRTAAAIVPGLQAPDSGGARRDAIAEFNTAVTAYGNQVNTIAAYRPGST